MTHSRPVVIRQHRRLLLALLLTWTTTASAGGLSFVEYETAVPNSALKDIVDVTVSGDGMNVYTASQNENMIGVFTRDPGTGALTFLELKEDGVGGVDGIRRASGVAVSPDGNCVYGTGALDDKVATFSRSPVTGALTFVGTSAVTDAAAVVVSPNNLHVYVLGSDTGSFAAVEVFSRTPPACALAFVEEETGDGSGLGKLFEDLAISSDGAHLYVAGTFFDGNNTQGAVNVLSRNNATGVLTFVERAYNGAAGVDRMGRVDGLAVSPDGGSVYAASRADDSVVVFARNGITGSLTFVEYQRDGGIIDGIKGANDVAVSPDNAYVYVVARGEPATAVFRRDTTSGALRFLEDNEDPYIDPPNDVMIGPIALALSPGGDSQYVGGKGATVFRVDACGDGNVGVDEQCDDGNVLSSDGCSATCRLELCGAVPSAGCRGTLPFGAHLRIKDLGPNSKDELQFKWNLGEITTIVEYGNPVTTATYLLCVYDGSGNPQPLLTAAAPAGGLCKNGKACWKTGATNDKYNDGLYTPDGLQKVMLKEGLIDGKAKIQFKGRGINLVPPTLPLTLPVTVQVKNTQTGVCWDAVFPAADANDTESFKAKGD